MKPAKVLIAILLLMAAREARAGVVDLGVVAEQLTINGLIFDNLGGVQHQQENYTYNAQLFVGANLNVVINGQTVAEILADDLGYENGGNLAFNFPPLPVGNAGNFEQNTAGLVLVGGNVEVSPNPTLFTLSSSLDAPLLAPVGTEVSLNPLDPVGLMTAFANANIIGALPGGLGVSGSPLTTTVTIVMDLGSVGSTEYQGELIETGVQVDNTSGSAVPEPASWSLIAFGAAVVGWRRRRQ